MDVTHMFAWQPLFHKKNNNYQHYLYEIFSDFRAKFFSNSFLRRIITTTVFPECAWSTNWQKSERNVVLREYKTFYHLTISFYLIYDDVLNESSTYLRVQIEIYASSGKSIAEMAFGKIIITRPHLFLK